MNSNSCPHCNKEYPANYEARYCPYCGAARPETVTPAGGPGSSSTIHASNDVQPIKISWLIIFGALLAPPLLTALVAFLAKGHTNESLSPLIGFFGGGLGGVAFGIMLALRISRTSAARVLLGILFAVLFAIVCITLCCFGCLASYQLNLH